MKRGALGANQFRGAGDIIKEIDEIAKLDIADLSGHLAPVLLFKKGNAHYLNNELNEEALLHYLKFQEMAKDAKAFQHLS